MMYYTYFNIKKLKIVLTSDGIYLISLSLYHLNEDINVPDDYLLNEDLSIFQLTKNKLDAYFLGNNPDFSDLKIKLIGTNFQQDVWQITKEIPYGKTITYQEIALKLAKKYHLMKMSAQAVGQALAHNMLAIIVPCHRVIKKNGKLNGYKWGQDIKQTLLEMEKTPSY